jgi:putative membrane protein
MLKHLLLMTVAAPLILAGATAFPLTCGLPKLFIHKHRFLATPLARRLRSGFTNPVLCWLAGTVAVIGWHLPVAFQLGMRSHWVHSIEDGSFLMAGLLFWFAHRAVFAECDAVTSMVHGFVPLPCHAAL